ncbi:MFS transporter [Sandaracinobacteroides saxicola]|uniref:MFS transporter n=1 Tax=Sandaracinobacteroides saxicola TaxID=2759707 RepID=A0A7G5IGE2_9SPHN|nr:MFS transporter [Sandaracinobacteroides saxicola]QMW22434.1 MFS transporter [Sandaracinobacteroides saxicola]
MARKFGPVMPEDGVSRLNMWTLMAAAFATIGLVTGMAVLTPYLLTQTLGLPEAAQGRALGQLTIVNEIVLIAAYGPLGVLADRYGRRVIYAAGFLAMAIAYALFPHMDSLTSFSAVRALYALGIGAATGMYGTLLADYAVERDRGKLAAIGGILNGLGVVMIALLLGRLPALFVARGSDPYVAAELTTGIAALLCAGVALMLWLGLKRGTPAAAARLPFRETLRRGLAAGRAEPDIVLAYAAAFVARGDLAIVGIFTVAWGKMAAVQAGMAPADALKAGQLPFIIAQSAALLAPLALIFVLDRVQRTRMLAITMGLGALGYLGMGFVDAPLEPAAIPFFAALGVGQIAAVLGAQTLIGKAAPEGERGAVIGLFNFFGAVGILIIGGVGGWAFDHYGPASPFIIVGVLNAVVTAAAVWRAGPLRQLR